MTCLRQKNLTVACTPRTSPHRISFASESTPKDKRSSQPADMELIILPNNQQVGSFWLDRLPSTPPIPRPPHPPKRKKTTLFRPHSLAEAGVVAGVRVGSRVMNVSCLPQTSRPLFHWELYRHGTSLQEQCYFSTPSFHLLFVSEALLHPMHWPQSLSMPSSANLEHWLSL